ncbi:sensor histidine kinase [Embleya sp. NPDC008237]|uniref:sensor histidine kinase n=1 Tax=Embleya sp. NPDC008237 TaxID=3363978 RepID=UPI0036E672EF
MSVLLALPLTLSRRRPALTLGLLLAETAVASVLTIATWPPLVAAAVLVGYLVATRTRRAGLLGAAAAIGVATTERLVSWAADPPGSMQFSDVLSEASLYALVVAVMWLVGNAVARNREYAAALQDHAAARAVVAERLRIARELHDMVARSVGIIAIQAGAARRVIDVQPGDAREALGAIETTSRETLAGMRRMLVALRQADPGDTGPAAPGLADLDRLAETARGGGVLVEVERRGEPRPLPAEIELAVYRIVQESLTNVVRHAASPGCRVTVTYAARELVVEVADNGRAGEAVVPGYGITGMRERAHLLDGEFSAGPRPEGGFRVAARLPA